MLEQIALCEELAREEGCLAEIELPQRKSVEIHTKLCDYGVQSRFVSEKAYAFTFRGIDFVSMEALLQGLKFEGV